MKDVPGVTSPLFERVGLVYRQRQAKPYDPLEPAAPTHVLQVVDPDDESQCWRVAIAVSDDDEARAYQRHLRGWVPFYSKIFLYRVGETGKAMAWTWGSREPSDICV